MAKRTHPAVGKRIRHPKPSGVRIIGGEWRGRRIAVAAADELRPTPDRVRETVFNWLAPSLDGSHCLDLFAGSGVLGWEALSRGAASVCLVERDRAVVQALRAQAATFGTGAAKIIFSSAEAFLAGAPQRFDIVFLDPPYATPIEPWLPRLWAAWLTPKGRIYVERDSEAALDSLAAHGRLTRRGRAGSVHYGLLDRGLASQGC